MNKQRKTSHILNVFQYDADGHVVLPASLTLGIAPAGNDNSGKVGTTAWVRTYVSGLSYQGAITLTVTGTSGAATLVGNTLNIPTYTLAGLGGQAALSGTGFVKISGTTISYDNNTYATQTYVGTQIANLVDSSPATLDTLNELAAALGDDPNFATTVATSIGTKQAQLNGTGFVKVTGTTVSYDNSTYALDSAVVKLAGTQTITGVKTFTGAGNTFTENANFQGRIFLKSDSTTNYTNLGGHTNQLLVGVIGATHILSFPENTNYTYTFPAASGTLAFTSNIPTVSGTSGYIPKFTGSSTIGNSLIYDTGSVILIGATTASDGQSKLELINNGPVGLKIKSSAGNGNNTFLSIESSKEWRFVTNRGDLISGNQGDLIIRNNTDGINHIILNQSGATTFYSSVTASGSITVINGVYTLPALTPSYFGYGGYGVLIVGNTNSAQTRSIAFGVDVSGNPSGSFSGYGSEYVWRNAGSFITPNSGNNGYNTLLSWNSSGQITFNQAATFSSSITTSGNINVNSDGIFINRTTSGEPYIFFRKDGVNRASIYGVTGGGLRIFDESDNQVLTITGTKVGISTNSPGAKLDVSYFGSVHNTVRLVGGGGTTAGNMLLSKISDYSDNSPINLFWADHGSTGRSNTLIRVHTNETSAGGYPLRVTAQGSLASPTYEAIAVNYLGNVGIGTTSPYAKLDVNGNIKNGARVYSGNSVIGNISPNLNSAATRNYILVCDLNDIAGFSMSGFMNAASYTCWNISSFFIMKNYSATTATAGITGQFKGGGCDMNIVDLNYGAGRYIAIGYTSNPEIDVIWTGYRLLHMLGADGSATVVPQSNVTVNSTLASY